MSENVLNSLLNFPGSEINSSFSNFIISSLKFENSITKKIQHLGGDERFENDRSKCEQRFWDS